MANAMELPSYRICERLMRFNAIALATAWVQFLASSFFFNTVRLIITVLCEIAKQLEISSCEFPNANILKISDSTWDNATNFGIDELLMDGSPNNICDAPKILPF